MVIVNLIIGILYACIDALFMCRLRALSPVVAFLLKVDPEGEGRQEERRRRHGEHGGRVLTRRVLPLNAILSWSARTRVMSLCLFDPLSRILMMVQMSRTNRRYIILGA